MLKPDTKMMWSMTLGSIFEIFDFLCFAFLSAIIAELFFPQYLQGMAIIFTYLTITISYLLRPIGGLILGHLGDKYGRKSVVMVSILLMSIPSLVIGLLPTFEQIGYFATALMILARILQGFSVGGEVPGAITYMAEKFKGRNFFFYCALLTFGANTGIVLAAQSIHLLTQFSTPEFMFTVGWRIPFFIGSLLALVAFYIRYSLRESEAFQDLQAHKKLSSAPIMTLFKEFKPQIICGVLLASIVSLTTSVFHVFLPGLLVKFFYFDLSVAANISSCGAAVLAIFSLLFAYVSYKRNLITVVRIALLSLMIIFTLILTNLINLNEMLQNNVAGIYGIVMLISLALSGINGLFFGLLASFFPTQVRFSGISISYNLAFVLGAGLTPLWTSSLLAATGSYYAIIAVCLGVVCIGLFNTIAVKKYARVYL
jgi:MFS family permease